jgi:hypothetical protein
MIGFALRRLPFCVVVVIPVLVDGARLPDPASLPEELRPLCRRHACELTDPRWSFDVGELVKNIEKVVPRPQPKLFTWLLGKLTPYLNALKLLYLQKRGLHWKTGVIIAFVLLLGIGIGFVLGQRENNTISRLGRPGPVTEPNNGIYEATEISFGSSVKSKITQRDPIDWYVFKAPDNVGDEFLVIYRYIDGRSIYVHIEVYDSNEKKLDDVMLWSSGESTSRKVKGDKEATYYVKVYCSDCDATYELAIRNQAAAGG